MKKNIIIISIALLIGILLGYILFNNSTGAADGETDHVHSEAEGIDMWTCSMHPQIMQPEPGQCPICGMDLIPSESGNASIPASQVRLTENALALANIGTTVVGTGSDVERQITLSGKIAQNEESNAVQASYFDGRIEKLHVSYEGQKVAKGSRLATIYSPGLVAAQQELITAAELKDTQPELYRAVRRKLKLWKLSDKQIETIENTGKVLEFFPIYANVSGTITEVAAREGDYVKQGQPILKVSNLSQVWAEFDAYESQIPLFKEGQSLIISTNAFPGKEFQATISFIDPMLNNSTRTTSIRATLANKDGYLKPGMFVKGTVDAPLSSADETITVPASAVLWTGERSLVYVKPYPDQPVFELREVVLGPKQGGLYVIESGLDGGEEVVTNGAFTVDAAAQLQGKRSMMNPENQVMDNEKDAVKMTFDEQFQKDFEHFLDRYIKMKAAFVQGDVEAISGLAKLGLSDIKKLENAALGEVELSHLKQSADMLEAIAGNEILENQRAHFVILNENIVDIAKNMDNFTDDLYVQYCPMANNNKGAFWLSSEKNILNPYYGDAMLNCGEVREKL